MHAEPEFTLDLLQHFAKQLPYGLSDAFTIDAIACVGSFTLNHTVTAGIGGYSLHGPFVEGVGCETILLGVSRSELVEWCKANANKLRKAY